MQPSLIHLAINDLSFLTEHARDAYLRAREAFPTFPADQSALDAYDLSMASILARINSAENLIAALYARFGIEPGSARDLPPLAPFEVARVPAYPEAEAPASGWHTCPGCAYQLHGAAHVHRFQLADGAAWVRCACPTCVPDAPSPTPDTRDAIEHDRV